MTVAETVRAPLLGADEAPPYEILNPEGRSRVILVCEHGGVAVPRQLRALGLGPEHYERHYTHDIGVRRVTQTLSAVLDAPAIIGNYSRLVVDLNRALEHPTAFPVSGEGAPVPGNITMGPVERRLRIDEIYRPFHAALARLVEKREAAGGVPVILPVHSYTPVFFGEERPWDAGVVWLQDARLPLAVKGWLAAKGYQVGDNEPYDAKSMWGTTANIYGDARRLPNFLLEIRNDLINNDEKCDFWAKMLGDCLQSVLEAPGLAGYYEGPQHEFGPET